MDLKEKKVVKIMSRFYFSWLLLMVAGGQQPDLRGFRNLGGLAIPSKKKRRKHISFPRFQVPINFN
ncbi:MAG: hypothetical protein DWQ02_05310 [Bacteroidetes bacterium]|nr:MAG: hypothetical protein DWQ02_05310 [Bacteroidota bacterium]